MLVNKGAAEMVADADAESTLVDRVIALINDQQRRAQFGDAARQLGVTNADQLIAELIVNKMKEKNA
jgi:UDP-N-acetylglucosamine:LPS N-acetylglucosamine transferase